MILQKLTRHSTKDLLCICSNNDFLQWVVRKYAQRSNHLSTFPALVFLRPFRCVITWNQKTLIIYPAQITVTAPVLKSQTVLRETMQKEWKIHALLPFRNKGIILSIPSTMTIGQAAVQRVSTMELNGKERFDSHRGGFLLPLDQMSLPIIFGRRKTNSSPPRRYDDPILIAELQRPSDLSYLKSSLISSPKSQTISSQETQKAAWRSFEEPMMKVQSLPTTSPDTSIDINRLTDRVYQAFERKVRLEKQRRGYR
jgi:hypothetical protein